MKLSLFSAALFAITRSEEICYMPLDVMFLQDTTGSFEDDLPNVLRQIPEMVSTITTTFPESWFGVAEFKDKHYFPLGESDDFCYKLGEGKVSGIMEDFQWAYSLLYASGGGDLPEAQFQALIDIALDPMVSWRELASSGVRAEADQAGARIVIMSTDAQPHLPGDMNRFDPSVYPDVPHNLPVNSGGISTGDVDYECFYQDYPSADQVKAALKQMNIYLVILTPEDPAIVPSWRWFNEDFLGQPASFYQFISSDSSDLLEGVIKAVEAVTQEACPTTTPAPETTPSAPTNTVSPNSETSPLTSDSITVATGTSIVGTGTTASTMPSTSPGTDGVTKPECPPCPPCPEPCPDHCHCHCHDHCHNHCHHHCDENPCNEGVIIKISDKPKYVNITLA